LVECTIAGRAVGPAYPPLVIAEIGINHEGSLDKALRMVNDAFEAGAECVKFQSHVIEDEMIPNEVVPGNARESIWDIMSRCALSQGEEQLLKERVESLGMIFLSTPFSRAAALRLHGLGVEAFKIGSGECNNLPLVELIAGFGKPIILSTGMNDLQSIGRTVKVIETKGCPYALLHCTSVYPTPEELVRLGALDILRRAFPEAVIGLSDHSRTIYPCLGAVALGASILERHFTSDTSWPGPDMEISMTPTELRRLIEGSRLIHKALGGSKTILAEEAPTIAFAYASVVAVRDIERGEVLDASNAWVKRPGTGEIKAADYERVLGRRASRAIPKDEQITWCALQ